MLRILVLDDEPMVRRIWERLASREANIQLRVVASPAEVWAALDAQTYDIIACDWQLDAGTCEKLVARLKRDGHRVVIVTGDVEAVRFVVGNSVPIYAKGPRIVTELAQSFGGSRPPTRPAPASTGALSRPPP